MPRGGRRARIVTAAMQSDTAPIQNPAALRIAAKKAGATLSTERPCTRCEQRFNRALLMPMGNRKFFCRKCVEAVGASWQPLAKDGAEKHYMKTYGLTLQEYGDMLLDQGGGCAICDSPPTEGGKLVVDHDHATGAVRGLLCGTCNSGIGMLKDDPRLLASAIMYLLR